MTAKAAKRKPISDETRRVWLAAHLMQTWTRDMVPPIRKAYKACPHSDDDGQLEAALLEARSWFVSAVASIDAICGRVGS